MERAVINGMGTLSFNDQVEVCRYVAFEESNVGGDTAMDRVAERAGMSPIDTNNSIADILERCVDDDIYEAVIR